MVEFNEDGSIKLPEGMVSDKERREKEKIILLERVDVQENNPAIARVRILIPHSIDNPPTDIEEYYKEKCESQGSVGQHKNIVKIDDREYYIEFRSFKQMYTSLDIFIKGFIRDYSSKGYKVEDKGSWLKFNN